MKRVSAFLAGIVVGMATLHTVMSYHLVQSKDGIHLIAKTPARLSESFVDIRSFTFSDWSGHPQLASALVQAGQQHLLGDSAATSLRQSVHDLVPGTVRQ